MAAKKKPKKPIKQAAKSAGRKGQGRVVPSELVLNDLKLKFTKVVNGVSFATLKVKSGAACVAGWDIPSRCLVHGQVKFDRDTSVLQAEFEGVHIRERIIR